MSQHTPGPWTVEEYGNDDSPALVIHHDSERRICFMATPGSHGDPAVIAANAHLIAAAPDLAKALSAAIGYMRNASIDLSTGCTKATAIRTIEGGIKMAEEALAKATGAK